MWSKCIEEGDALKVSPDRERALSLVKIADKRLRFYAGIKTDEASKNFVFEAVYTCAVEVLHAVLIAKGYKVLNHKCLCAYLRDVAGRADMASTLNSNRLRRNSLIYDGEEIPLDTAKSEIINLRKLIQEVKQWK